MRDHLGKLQVLFPMPFQGKDALLEARVKLPRVGELLVESSIIKQEVFLLVKHLCAAGTILCQLPPLGLHRNRVGLGFEGLLLQALD